MSLSKDRLPSEQSLSDFFFANKFSFNIYVEKRWE